MRLVQPGCVSEKTSKLQLPRAPNEAPPVDADPLQICTASGLNPRRTRRRPRDGAGQTTRAKRTVSTTHTNPVARFSPDARPETARLHSKDPPGHHDLPAVSSKTVVPALLWATGHDAAGSPASPGPAAPRHEAHQADISHADRATATCNRQQCRADADNDIEHHDLDAGRDDVIR